MSAAYAAPPRPALRTVEERNALAERNGRLVPWALGRHVRADILSRHYDDLQSVAWLGLLAACATWDPSRGSLSAWADRHIGQAVRLYLMREARAIRRLVSLDDLAGEDGAADDVLLDPRALDPADLAADREEAARLDQALSSLHAGDRLALTAKLQGEQTGDLAARLGVTTSMCHLRVRRAVKKLRERLRG